MVREGLKDSNQQINRSHFILIMDSKELHSNCTRLPCQSLCSLLLSHLPSLLPPHSCHTTTAGRGLTLRECR
jgi:hypothetical protein